MQERSSHCLNSKARHRQRQRISDTLTGAIFEAVHGSAPDIAGQSVANPLALLMSAVMMLNYLAEKDNEGAHRVTAERIRKAYDAVLMDGCRTRDLGGDLGTDAFAEAIIERLD